MLCIDFLWFFGLIFKHGVDVSFSVQNANDVNIVARDEIVDADGREPCHRPGPQSSQLWVLYQFRGADAGTFAYLADSGIHSGQVSLGHAALSSLSPIEPFTGSPAVCLSVFFWRQSVRLQP